MVGTCLGPQDGLSGSETHRRAVRPTRAQDGFRFTQPILQAGPDDSAYVESAPDSAIRISQYFIARRACAADAEPASMPR
jgi:hypothetical protein